MALTASEIRCATLGDTVYLDGEPHTLNGLFTRTEGGALWSLVYCGPDTAKQSRPLVQVPATDPRLQVRI